VGDREIVALGGLLDDNEQRTLQKVPLLGDVPVLGELFKSRGRSHVKTNLMVFIRPTIMRNANDRQELTARRYGVVRNAQRVRAGARAGHRRSGRGLPGRDGAGRARQGRRGGAGRYRDRPEAAAERPSTVPPADTAAARP
jgi:general secretion pathway protein D